MLRPVAADLGYELTCSAANHELSSVSLVQDKIKLEVYCKYTSIYKDIYLPIYLHISIY